MKKKKGTRKDDQGRRRADANCRRLRWVTLAARTTARTKVDLPPKQTLKLGTRERTDFEIKNSQKNEGQTTSYYQDTCSQIRKLENMKYEKLIKH